MQIEQSLNVKGHHLMTDIESCSSEIATYLANHSNWPQPIFPIEDGCSPLVFVPPYFDIYGSYWNCDSQELEGNL